MSDFKKARNHAYKRKCGSTVYSKSIRINGKKLNKYFSRKTDADRWYSEMKREKELVQAGMKIQTTSKKFGEFAEEWLVIRKAKNPITTWKTEQERINGFILPQFSERPMHQISIGEWTTFLDDLVIKRSLRPGTRNRYRTLLHKMYEDALVKSFVTDNPITRIPKWKENNNCSDYFRTKEECEAYLFHARGHHTAIHVFAAIALNVGLRLGEILALRNKDVDLDARQICINRIVENVTKKIVNRTKSSKARWVPISDSLLSILKGHMSISIHNKPEDLLICYGDGRVFSQDSLRKLHIQVCKKAGLKVVRIHDMRHTFASHFMMNGGNLYDLQKILGHSSYSMVQRYAHLEPNHLVTKANIVSFTSGETSGENQTKLRLV